MSWGFHLLVLLVLAAVVIIPIIPKWLDWQEPTLSAHSHSGVDDAGNSYLIERAHRIVVAVKGEGPWSLSGKVLFYQSAGGTKGSVEMPDSSIALIRGGNVMFKTIVDSKAVNAYNAFYQRTRLQRPRDIMGDRYIQILLGLPRS